MWWKPRQLGDSWLCHPTSAASVAPARFAGNGFTDFEFRKLRRKGNETHTGKETGTGLWSDPRLDGRQRRAQLCKVGRNKRNPGRHPGYAGAFDGHRQKIAEGPESGGEQGPSGDP